MEHTLPSEQLLRDLWEEKFSPLKYPSDFTRTWQPYKVLLVIEAFVRAKKNLDRIEKTSEDVARYITSTIIHMHRATEATPINAGAHLATAQDYNQLWKDFFTNLIIPPSFVAKWVSDHRLLNYAKQAFRSTAYALREDLPNKTSKDVAMIISSKLKQLSIAREEIQASRHKLQRVPSR